MDQYTEQLQALTDIRSMMQKSTRFVTLSGATGISIGLIALLSATLCFIIVGTKPFSSEDFYYPLEAQGNIWGLTPDIFILVISLVTIALAAIIGFYFTYLSTKKAKVKLWSKSFKLMIINIAIPLITGGFFCIFLLLRGVPEMVAPAMLIFYGLALINGGKYTLQDVNSLGILEIILGVVALWVNAYGIEFWAIGFGIFHILYGAKIYLNPSK